jgi:hypothetical protein
MNNNKNKYDNFVIYKIYQKDDPNMFYIGSTTNLSGRKSSHKKAVTNRSSKKYNYPLYQYIRALGGWDKFTFELFEKYPCQTKGDGLLREKELIRDLGAKLNKIYT